MADLLHGWMLAMMCAAAIGSAETATVKTDANLRAQPNTTSAIRAELSAGTAVDVVCWTQGEPTFGSDRYGSMWLYVMDGGWVHSQLITPVDVPPCGTGPVYANCDEAQAAGATPVLEGERGYGLHLDRDSDGVGCEWSD